MKKRITAFILAFALMTGCFALPGFAKDSYGFRDLLEGTVPAITTEQFVNACRIIRTFRNFFNGNMLRGDDDVFDSEMNEEVKALCKDISENSCLDTYELLTNLPDLNTTVNLTQKIFRLNLTEYRDMMYELAEKNENNSAKEIFYHLLGAYFSGIKSAYVDIEERRDGQGEIYVYVTYSDGYVEKLHPNITINFETGECHGPNGIGMFQTGFDFNAKDYVVTAPIYCWMRDFGFCIEYDWLCYLLPVYRYETRRFRFEYGEKEWMVQMWKGNYLITNGGEVGIYYRDKNKFGSYYDTVSDEYMIPMTLKIIHKDETLVDVEQFHWWVNGFRLANNNLYHPRYLTLESTLHFENEAGVYDAGFVEAFANAVKKELHRDVSCSVDYETNTVSLKW